MSRQTTDTEGAARVTTRARRHKIHFSAQSSAPPATVWRWVRDGATWPTWSRLGSFDLEREGDLGGESVGAIRVFRTGRTVSRELIVELVPERRLSYALLSGLPLKGYRADVDLEPNGQGTLIHWRSSFDAKVPGTGWAWRLGLGRFIKRMVHDLADHAATHARGLPPQTAAPTPTEATSA